MKTCGGLVCIRNGIELDYSFKEAISCLLKFCDQVVVSDCQSNDGTSEVIHDWMQREPKIKLHNYVWTDPRGTNQWFPRWINDARLALDTDHFVHLDADEILHEDSYDEVKRSAQEGSVLYCKRFNFWKDPQHLIPEGQCCGTKVIRVAPSKIAIPSDYPYEPALEAMRRAVESTVKIMHYGFIRHHEAFFRKARAVQQIWSNSYDPRLQKAEEFKDKWSTMPGVTGWESNLQEFHGTHPEIIKPWLIERGHTV